MADYVLIIKGGLTDYSDPDKTQAEMAKWGPYSAFVSEHTTIISGAGFVFQGAVVSAQGSKPYAAHGQDTVTGYYHLEAPDRAKVEMVAAKAPNIALGGTVEVRELLPPMQG